jgi:hypothetical protein
VRLLVPLVAAASALALAGCSSSGDNRPDAGWFQVRPMIMPGQHSTHPQADPFGSLHVPATENGDTALRPTQQAALRAALRRVDCTHLPSLTGSSARVVCDAQSDVFLLGAPLYNGNDVKKAMSLPPSGGNAQWSVGLSLEPAAADRLSRWTSRYHVLSTSGAFNDVQTSAKPPCGATTRTLCSDFLAYVSHDRVVTVPVTFAEVHSVVTVLGAFNEASAERLAHQITG